MILHRFMSDAEYECLIAGGKLLNDTHHAEPCQHTDGNGFARLKGYGHFAITHWLSIPKLNNEEIFETLPVE